MEFIQLIREPGPEIPDSAGKDIAVREVFDGERRRIVEISIINSAALRKHKAAEPITVMCLQGNGTFFAGPELTESVPLVAGTLLTLEADVLHEVRAQPEVQILVTKFKSA